MEPKPSNCIGIAGHDFCIEPWESREYRGYTIHQRNSITGEVSSETVYEKDFSADEHLLFRHFAALYEDFCEIISRRTNVRGR